MNEREFIAKVKRVAHGLGFTDYVNYFKDNKGRHCAYVDNVKLTGNSYSQYITATWGSGHQARFQ